MTDKKSPLKEIVGPMANVLFLGTAGLTLLYWTAIILRFINQVDAPIPHTWVELYLGILAAYVLTNQVEKACGENKNRPGQWFFGGWLVLTVVISGLVLIDIHGTGDDLSLIWPVPMSVIVGIFTGTNATKRTRQIVQAIKNAWNSETDKNT